MEIEKLRTTDIIQIWLDRPPFPPLFCLPRGPVNFTAHLYGNLGYYLRSFKSGLHFVQEFWGRPQQTFFQYQSSVQTPRRTKELQSEVSLPKNLCRGKAPFLHFFSVFVTPSLVALCWRCGQPQTCSPFSFVSFLCECVRSCTYELTASCRKKRE